MRQTGQPVDDDLRGEAPGPYGADGSPSPGGDGRFAILRPHLEGGVPLSEAAAAAGIPLRTAERWLARYRAGGITGLARRNPTGQRDGRFPDQLVTLVEGLFLRRPPPSIAPVHRLACDVARTKGWPEPSYMTVHRIATVLDPALVTLVVTNHWSELGLEVPSGDQEGGGGHGASVIVGPSQVPGSSCLNRAPPFGDDLH